MGRGHFNRLLKPDLARIVEAVGDALAERGCTLVEVYLTGGYGRVLSQALSRASGADYQALLDGCDKVRGDVDLLVQFRPTPAKTILDPRELERQLNEGIDETASGGKDYLIDLWLSDQRIVPRSSSSVRIYP